MSITLQRKLQTYANIILMTNINTKTLKGFRELLPMEQMAFNKMLETIRDTYELYGFIPLDTPVLERAEALLAKAGGETEQQIYQFTKGKTDYAMRFDLTVPLARYVAEHERELAFPFRRYAIGKVYRGERPQAGRLREFYQCDIDIIGKGELSLSADAELPSIISSIFTQILPTNTRFTIRVNNRKILNGFFSSLDIDQVATMRILDKLDKIGKDGVADELASTGVAQDKIDVILAFSEITGTNTEILAQLTAMDIDNEQFKTGLTELSEVVSDITQIDLSIARGLDYYTGTVYETTLDEYPQVGSICSGGRYDNLASTYTSSVLPGVGISIGLSRLFDQLKALELLELGASTPTKVLILSTLTTKSQELSGELRSGGTPTETQQLGKLDKQLKYANKLGIPYVVIIGDDELTNNNYTLKNMQTGEQQSLDKAGILAII